MAQGELAFGFWDVIFLILASTCITRSSTDIYVDGQDFLSNFSNGYTSADLGPRAIDTDKTVYP